MIEDFTNEKELQNIFTGYFNKVGYVFEVVARDFDLVDLINNIYVEVKPHAWEEGAAQLLYAIAREEIEDAEFLILACSSEVRIFVAPPFSEIKKFAREIDPLLLERPSSSQVKKYRNEGVLFLKKYPSISIPPNSKSLDYNLGVFSESVEKKRRILSAILQIFCNKAAEFPLKKFLPKEMSEQSIEEAREKRNQEARERHQKVRVKRQSREKEVQERQAQETRERQLREVQEKQEREAREREAQVVEAQNALNKPAMLWTAEECEVLRVLGRGHPSAGLSLTDWERVYNRFIGTKLDVLAMRCALCGTQQKRALDFHRITQKHVCCNKCYKKIQANIKIRNKAPAQPIPHEKPFLLATEIIQLDQRCDLQKLKVARLHFDSVLARKP